MKPFEYAEALGRCVEGFVSGDVEGAFADWRQPVEFKKRCANCTAQGVFQDPETSITATIVLRDPFTEERGANFNCFASNGEVLDIGLLGEQWDAFLEWRMSLVARRLLVERESDRREGGAYAKAYQIKSYSRVLGVMENSRGRFGCLKVDFFEIQGDRFLVTLTSDPKSENPELGC